MEESKVSRLNIRGERTSCGPYQHVGREDKMSQTAPGMLRAAGNPFWSSLLSESQLLTKHNKGVGFTFKSPQWLKLSPNVQRRSRQALLWIPQSSKAKTRVIRSKRIFVATPSLWHSLFLDKTDESNFWGFLCCCSAAGGLERLLYWQRYLVVLLLAQWQPWLSFRSCKANMETLNLTINTNKTQ